MEYTPNTYIQKCKYKEAGYNGFYHPGLMGLTFLIVEDIFVGDILL